MPPSKESWWVCGKCQKHIVRRGKAKGQATLLMREHRKDCDPLAGFWLKEVEHGTHEK